MTTLEVKAGQDARTCAGPGCGASLEGGPATARYCGERCRKGAHRARGRAERQVPERRKAAATTRRTRVTRPDPARAAADSEAFRRELERETLASLRADPERWRVGHAADPDVHRRRARRQPWRSTP